jgi:hypothetical protein
VSECSKVPVLQSFPEHSNLALKDPAKVKRPSLLSMPACKLAVVTDIQMEFYELCESIPEIYVCDLHYEELVDD